MLRYEVANHGSPCRSETIRVDAPAKLNLFLNVIGRRPDGFHDLESLMVTVGLCDTLVLASTESTEIELCCHFAAPYRRGRPSSTLSSGPKNLVVRAAELLRQTAGYRGGACITLMKRIPLEAGLAGGSTDAAATLVGLNRLWRLGLNRTELSGLGAQLGSDVPFFLCGSSAAVCRGRGELITPVAIPTGLHFVIAKPDSGLSTPAVFRHCQPQGERTGVWDLVRNLQRGRFHDAARGFHNTLEEPAVQLNADVAQLRKHFQRRLFIGHMMSGSGTSYFGQCSNADQALAQANTLRQQTRSTVFAVSTQP